MLISRPSPIRGSGRGAENRCRERRLRKTTLIRPNYDGRFHCIGPACEDSCCAGWGVSIDQATWEKYQGLPPSPLRTLIDERILRSPDARTPAAFASIGLLPSLQCPFHNPDGLCRIQVERGESYLSHTCATFPRTVHTIDALEEKTLTLSCPEAARLVLLDPDLQAPSEHGKFELTWDDHAPGVANLRCYFWPIRQFVVSLLRNRSYPLWQRMFLIGSFARRLDALVRGERDRGFPAVFRDFSAAVASGSLRASIETIPANLPLQLEMLLSLVNLRVGPAGLPVRLVECLTALVRGVGNGAATTIESQAARYAQAYRRFYAPFFLRHPHILENFLLNTIFRRLFPFGVRLFDASVALDPAGEFEQLATEFALVKGLLIGVAGAWEDAFSADHVVQTVQTAIKHFEHDPGFLEKARALLVARRLNTAQGLTMLLRN